MFVLDWLGQKLLTADCADSQFLLNLSPSGPGPCLGLLPSVHLARVQIKIVPVWRKLNLLDAKLCNIELSFIMLLDFYINERMFWEIHLYMYINSKKEHYYDNESFANSVFSVFYKIR